MYFDFVVESGGIGRRAWGKVHLMRSGKRSDVTWQDDENLDDTFGEQIYVPVHGSEEVGIDLDELQEPSLRRISRSDSRFSEGQFDSMRSLNGPWELPQQTLGVPFGWRGITCSPGQVWKCRMMVETKNQPT